MNIRECDLPNVNKSGIYCITNLVNGKKYVGQCGNNFMKRWNCHKSEFKRNEKHNSYFQKAYNKYGISNFEFSILEIIEQNNLSLEEFKELLCQREQYWIDYYDVCNSDNGYNLSPTAGSILGIKFSEEQNKKNSEAQLKFWNNNPKAIVECSKRNIGVNNPMYGKHHSEETKQKIRNANLGKKKTLKQIENCKLAQLKFWNEHPEVKSKISKMRIEKAIAKGGNNGRAIPIVQLDLENNIIRKYNYVGEVILYDEYKNYSLKIIRACANHKYKTKKSGNEYNIYMDNKWVKQEEYNEQM